MSNFDVKDLVQNQNKECHDREWRMDPVRIKNFIKKSAEQVGLVLKNPEPNCPKCHGRGWTGVDVNTGIPVVCRCIFFKEDLHNQEEVPSYYLRPRNRQERRREAKILAKMNANKPKQTTKPEESDINLGPTEIGEDRPSLLGE